MRLDSHSERSDKAGVPDLPELSSNYAREMKGRQCAKIREIGDKLRAAGYVTLGDQAQILGLPRSTTWALLRGNHKASGLSAAVINRILARPDLPLAVTEKILEYVKEKVAGHYGHRGSVRRKFVTNLCGPNAKTKKQDLRSRS